MARKTKLLPIQVGTIVYNEKDRLPKWLKHWLPIAERIIIIDQGSDDGTQAILKKSGVTWHECLPRGNPDIHWNHLIGLSRSNQPFFRLGIDEFISRSRLKKILKVIKKHPNIVLWWMRRINWINGIDAFEHPEVKQSLGNDWQAVVSFGRPYTFNGRIHNWPTVTVPGEQIGFIGENVAWIDHRRTLEEVIGINKSRAHVCRVTAGNDQEWFQRVCKELVDGNYPKEGGK
jgi:glycosyltransferase involved in cell wall biosynthesis